MKFITILIASSIFMLTIPVTFAGDGEKAKKTVEASSASLEERKPLPPASYPPPAGERFGPPQRSGISAQTANRIDIQQGGSVCYSNQQALKLWRQDADSAVWVSIQDLTNDTQVRLPWPAQQHVLAWPVEKMPVMPNSDYILQYGDMPIAVSLYPIPGDLASDADRQAWMQQKGCFW
jgi:hypothetical protein